MKRTFITIIALIIALLVGWWVYHIIGKINAPESEITFEEAPIASERTDSIGVERIEYLAKITKQAPVEFNDYIYLGGEWGLLVGNKAQAEFQQYITQNEVRNVTVDDVLLQYEEWNPETQIWEFKSINLKAYSTFLQNQ